MYTIKDLQEGKCAVINDGTFEQLKEVTLKAGLLVNISGDSLYYYKIRDSWKATKIEPDLPIQSVKDFYIEIIQENIPEKWCVDANREVADIIKCNWYKNSPSHVNYFLFHKNIYYAWSKEKKSEYKKVSIEEFKKYYNMKEIETTDSRFPFKLSFENAKRIINIACLSWKSILADKWSKDLILNNYVTVNEDYYKRMRSACTEEQHILFDEIFGKDVKEIDLKDISTVYGLQLFMEDGTYGETLMSVRSSNEYKNKAFYLNKDFNWEIVKDSKGVYCLVPTKK